MTIEERKQAILAKIAEIKASASEETTTSSDAEETTKGSLDETNTRRNMIGGTTWELQ